MNYYERHIGDYLKDTAHLSLLEHGVYTRLLDVYYTSEAAVPDAQACRLVGAKTAPERAAVKAVLEEFFELVDGAWHQTRCDREIERYVDGEPEREVKKANEDNRLKRHREERARLFKVITDAGQHAAWNIPMSDLRALAERIAGPGPETGMPPLPATAPATPATATQSPIPSPNSQPPVGKDIAPPTSELPDRALSGLDPPPSSLPASPPRFDGMNAAALNGKAVVELAPGWELPEAWGNDAVALGWKPHEVLRLAEEFRQHWTVGKGAGKRRGVKGWRQGWSNWLRIAAEKRR